MLHQSFRKQREDNDRYEKAAETERVEGHLRDAQRHLAWFKKTTGNEIRFEELKDASVVARFVKHELPHSNPSNEDEQLANMEDLFLFLRECGLNLTGVQACDVQAGNINMTAALLWGLRHFVDVLKGNFIRVPSLVGQESSSAGSGSTNPDVVNLRSLYSAGFIGDEEFKRRLAELGGSDEAAHDSFKCECSSRPCGSCSKAVKECCVDDHDSMCAHGTIACPICETRLARSDFSVHLEKCRVQHSTTPQIFDQVTCEWCNESMSIISKPDHDITCLHIPHACPMKQFGCEVQVTRQDCFSHIMDCRKNFLQKNEFAENVCDYCGEVLRYAKEWENEEDNDKEARFQRNEDVGSHVCSKRHKCPIIGCGFEAEDIAVVTRHLEQDCLQNEIECVHCKTTLLRRDSLTHKCCDFARAMVGVLDLKEKLPSANYAQNDVYH